MDFIGEYLFVTGLQNAIIRIPKLYAQHNYEKLFGVYRILWLSVFKIKMVTLNDLIKLYSIKISINDYYNYIHLLLQYFILLKVHVLFSLKLAKQLTLDYTYICHNIYHYLELYNVYGSLNF